MTSWQTVLGAEKQKPYFKQIMAFLEKERQQGKIIYPQQPHIFNALKLTHYEDVNVVILGQDPYHGHQQAHGLSFSVVPGIKPPPSLMNIFKELSSDLGIDPPQHGCLAHWATQGVLLLNTSLTVVAGKPQSHSKIGWQIFTDKVISSLNEHQRSIIFMLWGSHAQQKIPLINSRHHILTAPHPSPLSAHRGFLGCQHFSKANKLLQQAQREPIDWALTTN